MHNLPFTKHIANGFSDPIKAGLDGSEGGTTRVGHGEQYYYLKKGAELKRW